MAQFNKNKQRLLSNNDTIYEMNITSDQYGFPDGAHGMGAATKYSAFGETMVTPLTPTFQLDAIYGLDPRKFETYTGVGGSVDTDGPYMFASTGTNQYGYGVVRSRRAIRYRPGQGAVARFTAAYTAGVDGYTQRAGFFTQEQALQVGYNGTQWGILRANGGKATIYELTISAASTGAETVTITLNGTAFPISVGSGTIAQNAKAIAGNSFAGWIVEEGPTYVRFLSDSLGVKAGAFTVSSTGTFAGTMNQLQVGVAQTEEWIYQSDFNLDPLDGTGPSGMTLDPTKLNVFQIDFRWLGAGQIRFAVENESNGDMIFFHHIHYVNRNTTVHLDNPSLKVGYVAYSTGGIGTNVTVYGASIMGAIQGDILFNSATFSRAITSSTLLTSGSTYHVMSLHNRLILNNKINAREIILSSISAGGVSSAANPIVVSLYFNQSIVNGHSHVPVDETWSSAYISTDATTIVPNTVPIYTFIIQSGATETIDLSDLRIVLPPNNHITIGVSSTANISSSGLSLTWIED